MRKIDETEKCWLDYDEDGHLTCTYNHKAGAECLLDDREEDEFYERVFNMAEFMNLAVPEVKTDPRHLDPRDEDFIEIENSTPFKLFILGKRVKELKAVIWLELKPIIEKVKSVKYLPEIITIIVVCYFVTSLVLTFIEN